MSVAFMFLTQVGLQTEETNDFYGIVLFLLHTPQQGKCIPFKIFFSNLPKCHVKH